MYKVIEKKKKYTANIETVDEYGGFDNIHIWPEDHEGIVVLINHPFHTSSKTIEAYEEIVELICEKFVAIENEIDKKKQIDTTI